MCFNPYDTPLVSRFVLDLLCKERRFFAGYLDIALKRVNFMVSPEEDGPSSEDFDRFECAV